MSNFRSQYEQDKFCFDNFLHKLPCRGFFVEVGASDGVKFSNTFFYEKSLNWSGLCVEPRKIGFEKLVTNRKCFCENVGIAKEKDRVQFLEMDGWGEGMSGIIDKYDPRHLSTIERYIKTHPDHKSSMVTSIDTVPLQSLLDKYILFHINFLSVDTEGGELEILKSIDWEKTSVDVITVENNYESKEYFHSFLSQLGFYYVTKLEIDEIYVHSSFLSRIVDIPKRIMFFSTWTSSENLLKEYKNMLPNGRKWMSYEGTSDYKEADILVVMEGSDNKNVYTEKEKKLICFPREPEDINQSKEYMMYFPLSNHLKFTYDDIYHSVSQFNFMQKDINYFLSLMYRDCKKSRNVSCIVSNKRHTKGAISRLNFLKKIQNECPNFVDVFGRERKEIKSKCEGLIPYRYSICMENTRRKNYFTEKFTDAMMCWTIPIYWGCHNIGQYFPSDSFYEIDIESNNCISTLIEILHKPIMEKNIKAMHHARNLIFSRYNIWNTIDSVLQIH